MIDNLTIFWFRQDLRISDNPGLFEAARTGSVLPIYILDDESSGAFKIGGASRWWLHHSLNKLNESLDNKLNIYTGKSKEIILRLTQEKKVNAVYWNRCYEPYRIKDDSELKAQLKTMNIGTMGNNKER